MADNSSEKADREANGERPAQPTSTANVEDVFSQFQDLFSDFFGTAGVARDRGADLRISLALTERDAQLGCKRDLDVMRARVCTDCSGAGGSGESTTCKDCGGAGTRSTQQGFVTVQATCETCRGTPTRWTTPCRWCERGLVRQKETLSVVVPAGIEHGQMLRLVGKGDELAGNPSGHLYVAITIEGHVDAGTAPELGTLRDRGDDVVVDAAVRVTHLWFGGSLEVPTPDGSATVTVPRGIADGHEIRIAGRGKPRATGGAAGDPYRDVARGDVVVVLRVTPAVQKQREAIKFAALALVVISILVAFSLR